MHRIESRRNEMAREEIDPTRTVMLTIATLPLPTSVYRHASAMDAGGEAPRRTDEQPAWARRAAEEAARQAREAREEREREVRRALMSARVDLRQKIENDLDFITKSADWLEQRSSRMSAAVWPEIRRLLREVLVARESVERDLYDLRPTTIDEIMRMRRGLEMRVAELKQALQHVEVRI
jgi:hypothetical protein